MSLRDILLSDDPVAVLRNLDATHKLRELEPTLADLRMDIPKGYHHKDNLTHSLKVLENAIQRETTVDLVLRTAALFHDVGKPATRKFHDKGLVTFDGHETVGARMVKKILVKHGYSKSEIAEISKLVAFHMRSHGFTEQKWTDSAVRRLITEVGDNAVMARLLVVFYADVTTRFPEKRKNLHRAVDALKEKMDEVASLDARKALRPSLSGHDIMELFSLTPGRELGAIMKFLNSDEGIVLSREDAIQAVKDKFFA